jgi:hypothetical protein
VPVLLEEGTGFPNDVADGGSAHAEGIGEDVQDAQPSLVQDGEQDAFAVADLLREDAAAGTGLAWATAALVAEAFGLSCLPCGEPLGDGLQLVTGKSGQGRVESRSMMVVRVGRRSLSRKVSRSAAVAKRTEATPGS